MKLLETGPVTTPKAPSQSKQHQGQNREAKTCVPCHHVAAHVAGHVEGQYADDQQPEEQTGGKSQDPNGRGGIRNGGWREGKKKTVTYPIQQARRATAPIKPASKILPAIPITQYTPSDITLHNTLGHISHARGKQLDVGLSQPSGGPLTTSAAADQKRGVDTGGARRTKTTQDSKSPS